MGARCSKRGAKVADTSAATATPQDKADSDAAKKKVKTSWLNHDRVGTVLDRLKLAPFDARMQEEGMLEIYRLCANPFDGDVTRRHAGDRGVIEWVKYIQERSRRKELVLRACVHLLAELAKDEKNCEIMRKNDVWNTAEYTRDDEFDDEWIRKDCNLLEVRMHENGEKTARRMIEDAKLEENVTPAVRAMHTFPTYVSVQEAAMDYIESRIEVAGEMDNFIAAEGLEAMIALFANHGESPKLLHRSLDLLYNMTRHDKNLAAEFGKKNGLNPLVRLMRTYVEEPDGDIIQLSFHCMVELCKVDRNAERFNNRNGKALIKTTEANARHQLYDRPVHIPFKLRKALEPLGEPEVKEEDMGMVDEKTLDADERELKRLQDEMEALRYKRHRRPKSRLEEEKLKLILQAREGIKRKREEARKFAMARKRREAEWEAEAEALAAQKAPQQDWFG